MKATPWEQVGPGLVFVPVPEGKTLKNRLHIDLAPHTSDDRDAEIAALLERGATLVDVGQPSDVTWTVLAIRKATSSVFSRRETRSFHARAVYRAGARDAAPPLRPAHPEV